MKRINLNEIEINGEKYPLYCDMNVLEQIQDSGISINEFERQLIGAVVVKDADGDLQYNEDGTIKLRRTDPVIKTVMFGLALMINEGYKVRELQDGQPYTSVSAEELKIINDIPYVTLSVAVHEEFNRCFYVKKDIAKGEKDENGDSVKKKTRKRKTIA